MLEKVYSKDHKIIHLLQNIVQHELEGILRYTDCSFRLFGYSKLVLLDWMKEQAREGLEHAEKAGSWLIRFEQTPNFKLEYHSHLTLEEDLSVVQLLDALLEHERKAVNQYLSLLSCAKEDGHSALEDYAQTMVSEEYEHLSVVKRILKGEGMADFKHGKLKS